MLFGLFGKKENEKKQPEYFEKNLGKFEKASHRKDHRGRVPLLAVAKGYLIDTFHFICYNAIVAKKNS